VVVGRRRLRCRCWGWDMAGSDAASGRSVCGQFLTRKHKSGPWADLPADARGALTHTERPHHGPWVHTTHTMDYSVVLAVYVGEHGR
jgi:hypothetical protein